MAVVPVQGSLEELNAGMAEALPMNRFRPNIVVTGAPGWTEDAWRRFSIGAVDFEAVRPCSRCKVAGASFYRI